MVYVTPSIIYCCQVWQGGNETLLKSIEKVVDDLWKLSPSGPPTDFIGPRVLLIMFDLNYAKKMWDGISAIDFKKIYKTDEDINSRENEEEHLRKRPQSLKSSKLRFSLRTRNYWNLLPKKIRHLRYDFFKKEAKKFVVNNKACFLNFGNKDKTGPRFLPKYVPYLAPAPPRPQATPTNKPPPNKPKHAKTKGKISKFKNNPR